MHDRQHLAWLLEGVDSWNKRRNEEDFVPNLEGADINAAFGGFDSRSPSRIPLKGVDLSRGKLKGANLSYADLENANFALADLTEADLTWCNIENAHMPMAILDNTRIYFSSLSNTNWACTDPWEAVLFEPLDTLQKQMKKMHKKDDVASSVDNVGSLVAECRRINQHYAQHPARTTLYFRGESNAIWEMRPTVMRDSDSPKLRFEEGRMLVDLMSRQPEVFDSETLAFSSAGSCSAPWPQNATTGHYKKSGLCVVLRLWWLRGQICSCDDRGRRRELKCGWARTHICGPTGDD